MATITDIKLKRSATAGKIPLTTQLDLGEIAINTHDGKLYIKKDVSGTESIVLIGPASASDTVYSRYIYTATASQTTFTGADDNSNILTYDIGYADVYVNGVKLITGTDFTATSGSSVVMATGLAESDIVEIIVMGSGSMTNLIVTRGMNKFVYTATSSQTTFSGADDNTETLAYTVDQIQVYFNGALLDASDYTASNGTSVVLGTAADAGDIVTVVALYTDDIDYIGDLDLTGNLTVSGNATIAGNLTFGNASTDTVTFSADITSNILPDVDSTYTLGSNTQRWSDIYTDNVYVTDNVGIGTASPITNLDILDTSETVLTLRASNSSATRTGIRFQDGGTGTGTNGLFIGRSFGGNYVFTNEAEPLIYGTNGKEAMPIDSSGNLLVGTTSLPSTLATTSTEAGLGFDATFNYLIVSRAGAAPLNVNRLTNDGDIINLRKNGSVVGSLGTTAGELTIGSADTALRFTDAADRIDPWSVTSNLAKDNAIDFGTGARRFKDLYLGGAAYINGITVGRGAGDVSTNTTVGNLALAANTSGANNVANGYVALRQNTTGSSNVATGSLALYTNTTGNSNVATGYQTLYDNTDGDNNTATGYAALSNNTTGSNNVATGYMALLSNTTGSFNTAIGRDALFGNTTANNNTATGYQSLYFNTGAGNTATGLYALRLNTTGSANTASGLEALYANTTGINNTATGWRSLYLNTTANNNAAYGYASLYSNTTGTQNTASGTFSLYTNSTGIYNTAYGYAAMYNNTAGGSNVALGMSALYSNTIANNNVGVGYAALYTNTTGGNNSAVGRGSLYSNTTGASNTAVGYEALYLNTTGANNTATGFRSLNANTTGINNTALGYASLQSNTTGNNNIGLGVLALSANTTGLNNVAIGRDSLLASTTGNGNTAVGVNSGYLITTGAKNTIIGAYSGNQGGLDIRTSSNNIVLSDGDGNPRQIIDSSGKVLVGRTSTITFSTNTTDGIVLSPSRIDISAASLCRISQLRDSTGTYDRFYNGDSIVGSITGTTSATAYNTSSDQRLKENIADANDAGSKVDAIQVRQFDWKADGSHQDYGMVAQELMTVVPEAVSVHEDPEEMMGVDYSKLVPMLIKEIQSLRNRVATLEGN